MEESKLNFNAPLLSVRRTFTKPSCLDEKPEKITQNSRLERKFSLPVVQKSDHSFDHLMEPASVPFVWEQTPGRPKDKQQYSEASITLALPPPAITEIVPYPLEKDIGQRNPGLNEYWKPMDVQKRTDWNADEECDLNSDAVDTLSKTDSFSMNCSATDMSGLDGLGVGYPGTFYADQQTRDFMMNRFLPAAKAVTLEQPQYSSKKQPVAVTPKKSLQVRKAFSGEINRSINHNRCIVVPSYPLGGGDDESEATDVNEEPNHGLDIHLKTMRKGCGLLSRICIKNALCILNPVPGLKPRMCSLSSNHDTRRTIKTVEKHLLDSVVKPKSLAQSPKLSALHSKMSCRSNQVLNDSCEPLTPHRVSPYRRSACSSPYRSVIHHSSFREAGFPSSPREAEILRAHRLNKHVRGISRSQEFPLRKSIYSSGTNSPVSEKTLYVDTVKLVRPRSRIGASVRNPTGTAGTEDSPVQDFKAIVKEAKKIEGEVTKEFRTSDHGDTRTIDSPTSPRPPPLPKTPSESWLWRTLPSVPSPNPYPHSRFCDRPSIVKRQDPKPFATSTKWETIVKTSHLHHDHIRFSEELVPHHK